MNYLERLNEQQKKAVTSTSQYIRVNAGAGSGKTTVLALRIVNLVLEHGVDESSILAITFTNKVAKEMQERVKKYLEKDYTYVSIYTFHSFCAQVLRYDIRYLEGNFTSQYTILDEDDQSKYFRKLFKAENNSSLDKKEFAHYVAKVKSNWTSYNEALTGLEKDYNKKKYNALFLKYEKYLREHNSLDFDDLLLKSLILLKDNPNILQKWQHKFQYFLVDEFQDTNDIQYELLTLLAGTKSNIFVVGDPDQNIYSWRGSNIRYFLGLERDFPSLETITLEENYRSTEKILEVANRLIKNNKQRLDKKLFSSLGVGEKVRLIFGNSAKEEAKMISETIYDLKTKYALHYRDFTILYRANSCSREFETQLMISRIPYVVIGGLRFYQREEIKDTIAYLRLVVNPKDDVALLRALQRPSRGMGEKALAKLEKYSLEENVSLYEALIKHTELGASSKMQQFTSNIENLKSDNKVDLTNKVKNFLEKIGYLDYWNAQEDKEIVQNKLENIDELIFSFKALEDNDPNINLEDILQNLSLLTSQDDLDSQNATNDAVKLMTIHIAKGLEFDNVFLVNMVEGTFPSMMSTLEGGIEEERRIAYVGMTRAKQRLFLSFSGGFDYKGAREQSRFIKEAMQEKQITYTYLKEKLVENKTENKSIFNLNIFRINDNVRHPHFGTGVIINVTDTIYEIDFKDNGLKKISKSYQGLMLS
ncbi:MAG: UvrD-helicase domain-containing protein [Bacillales bacterium]|jgi:DNA helicase-2/ATP-dependent DNA helicase PcrA|nr:UvrD-helicase domain-containing protein [Bacillales bacterium]